MLSEILENLAFQIGAEIVSEYIYEVELVTLITQIISNKTHIHYMLILFHHLSQFLLRFFLGAPSAPHA